jgi:hypothetical protein
LLNKSAVELHYVFHSPGKVLTLSENVRLG